MTRMDAVFIFGAAGTTGDTFYSNMNGCAEMVIVKSSDMADGPTVTIKVLDPDDNELWASAALAHNTTTRIGANVAAAETGCIPIGHNYKVTCTLSAAAGVGGGTVHAYFYID